MACQIIELREEEAPAEPRVFYRRSADQAAPRERRPPIDGDMVCQIIELREEEAPAEPPPDYRRSAD